MRNNKLDIFHVRISKIDYPNILTAIEKAFNEKNQITFTGANVNTINLALKDLKFGEVLSRFDIVHPDGIGIYLASKLLYGRNGFASRMTGSDFYVELIKNVQKNNWSFFFFGDTNETLSKISKANPELSIKGFSNGFNFNDNEVINDINTSKPDILIVGLGSPKQEKWIVANKDNINAKVIIAVGDGIKVFAGTKKRGPKFLQILGLEWVVRLLFEPKRLWKRYIIGIPLFILRVLKYKLSHH